MKENETVCSHCGCMIENDDQYYVGDDVLCQDCYDHLCTCCDHCGHSIYLEDAITDDYSALCSACYHAHYIRCDDCNCIIAAADSYELHGYDYCRSCYEERCDEEDDYIHEYGYKPEPVFYGEGKRFMGVELEIDRGGKSGTNAEQLYDIANHNEERIYIKSDGSLNDGMEIVTHPMSLAYHKNEFCWEDILHRCVEMGYRSHQTSTCGLHIHVSRKAFGDTEEQQEEVISRILYFVEAHWNELLNFSRRTESSMNRWAARYGYESHPKAIMDKAKKGCGRYAAVNLCNYHTVEFRLFRGTLKYNTLIAALELVNAICDAAIRLTDAEMQGLSWSLFVSCLDTDECADLIEYLKLRRLYTNDVVNGEEDL